VLEDLGKVSLIEDIVTYHLNNNYGTYTSMNSNLNGKIDKSATDKRNMVVRVLLVVQKSGLSRKLVEWKQQNTKPCVDVDRTAWTASVAKLAAESSLDTLRALEAMEKRLDAIEGITPKTSQKTSSVPAVDRRRVGLVNRLKKARAAGSWVANHADVLEFADLVTHLMSE
jgi:hypothetical protein